jgi:hypothetical protein
VFRNRHGFSSLIFLSALVEQCLSAGQSALASSVMSPLPVLLARLVFSSAPYPPLQRLTIACGAAFKTVLKVTCHMGCGVTDNLENLWKRCVRLRVGLFHFYFRELRTSRFPYSKCTRTFECISVVLCLKPLLASPSLVFASTKVVAPPAEPLLIAALKEEFLPIASK